MDSREVFFGPCKKSLRRHLKATLMGEHDDVSPASDIYVVGFNALPSAQGPRRVVWAGRITRLMTFARAWEHLVGPRYGAMRDAEASPLHVEPITDGEGALAGYKLRRNGVHAQGWQHDLASNMRRVTMSGDRLLLKSGVRACEGLARDVCFTAENLFFASGHGLDVDGELVDILRAAQPGVEGIDNVAVFGRTPAGHAEGYRGRYLTIASPTLVTDSSPGLAPGASGSEGPANRARAVSMAVVAMSAARARPRRGGRDAVDPEPQGL